MFFVIIWCLYWKGVFVFVFSFHLTFYLFFVSLFIYYLFNDISCLKLLLFYVFILFCIFVYFISVFINFQTILYLLTIHAIVLVSTLISGVDVPSLIDLLSSVAVTEPNIVVNIFASLKTPPNNFGENQISEMGDFLMLLEKVSLLQNIPQICQQLIDAINVPQGCEIFCLCSFVFFMFLFVGSCLSDVVQQKQNDETDLKELQLSNRVEMDGLEERVKLLLNQEEGLDLRQQMISILILNFFPPNKRFEKAAFGGCSTKK